MSRDQQSYFLWGGRVELEGRIQLCHNDQGTVGIEGHVPNFAGV